MNKILVANRGEIALRILKTIHKMGLKTVAVYSTADRKAPHVLFADEAVCLGEPASSESYLNANKIISAAKALQVDAIHPGYGFLSENAAFATAVVNAGIIFIGPKPHAINVMGSKLAAKEAVKNHEIPMVPGVEKAVTTPRQAKEIAQKIGYPVLIKASAGGGGKGMRIVEQATNLEPQMQRAISEATAAFGDGAVFIEKYIAKPRHIEIQILADQHGNTVHLFERECSIQRRHQKVIEEAPSCVLTPTLRQKMGEAAVRVAKACDYVGAGTVEFLLDADHNFYFLEMNTRLQVEHPVTEIITGLDLVQLQIEIAQGKPLPFAQNNLKIKGHAVELRVYAEDPSQDFLPSVGTLEIYKVPKGQGIRVDNGYTQGMQVPIFYDPMLSKLITYGETRKQAITLMIKAIKAYAVEGVQTTLSFGTFVMQHPAFITGDFDTHFVANHYQAQNIEKLEQEDAYVAAIAAFTKYTQDKMQLRLPKN